MSQNKETLATRAAGLAVGVRKHLAPYPALPLGGKAATPAQVEATLERFVRLRRAVEEALANYRTAVLEADAAQPEMAAYLANLTRFVRGAFGNSPDVLFDFGIAPIKERPPLTVEEQAAAVAKRHATRLARGTRGPVARLAIHGDVTGVTVTPVVAPVAQPEATKRE